MAETVTRGLKYTSLEELEKQEKGPVWVLNNTRDSLEGKVIISVAKRNGNGYDIARIPRSFIPFDLTQQVPRAQLLDSADFRKSINSRMIRLVTSEYASVLLSTDEAKEELERVRNEDQKARALLKRAGVMEGESTGVGEDDEEEYFEVAPQDGSAKKAKKAKPEVEAAAAKKTVRKPSVKVQSIVAEASRDELTETQIVAKLRNVSNMKRVDLAYLSREYSDKPRILKYLKSVKKEMEAAA